MAQRSTRTFSDINLLFTKHPITSDVVRRVDDEAIKGSLRNLISTKHFEKPFHPEIGCQIHSLLFENFDPITVEVMKKTISETVRQFEPRVRLLDINIVEQSDPNGIDVTVTYKTINSDRPLTISTTITRVR